MLDLQALSDELVALAIAKGADAAKAGAGRDISLGVTLRLGKKEKLDRAESCSISLEAYVGKRKAVVSTSDLKPAMLAELAERAVAMARAVPEDPYCGLAEPELLATAWPELDLNDANDAGEDQLIEMASRGEEAALSVPGVTNSEGAEAGWNRAEIFVSATNGDRRSVVKSTWAMSVSVLAGESTAMERDYDSAHSLHLADLEEAAGIGRRAGERAVKRLNPRRIETARMPIVYDPRTANGLISHLAGAINGASIARGTSFLKESLGQRIFAKAIEIVDDPHRIRGHRSRPFDTEGVANATMTLVEDGVLQTWLLDCRSARQLGLSSNGRAGGGSPSVTNLFIKPGRQSPDQLMSDVERGFYVCELMGMGVNLVTGDYSRGASGYLIEHGEITVPVSEVTIAGNLKDMFLNLVPANDLVFRRGVDAPTIRVDGMTLAGA